MPDHEPTLKARTAHTLKWNLVDRLSAQILYAVTGIILARLLSQEDFGLVGAVLVFQAFASLLVDSGFSSALLQRKSPTHDDYSTVLWFNIILSIVLYVGLYFAAPFIADCFQGDVRLIPLSRVMFVSIIINAATIVQVNRLMKRMDVRMVAISNTAGLIAGGAIGIILALNDYGAWAIVWQTLTLSAVKAIVLWLTQHWWPSTVMSIRILKSYFRIGSRMMLTSFLNTIFINLYSFFVGNRAGMASLGYYTQSDKWSKMGIMSVYQVLTSSFLPVLADVQDDRERFNRVSVKINRFTSFLVFPAFIGLIAIATPLFHGLFGTKWDASIVLFQLLLVRGIFTVFIGYYNNVLLALGHARTIMWMEVLRDTVAIIALVITLPVLAESRGTDIVWGIRVMLYGQILASLLTWAVTLVYVSRLSSRPVFAYIGDMIPYVALSIVMAIIIVLINSIGMNDYLTLAVTIIAGATIYLGIGHMSHSVIQREALGYILGRNKQ